MPDVLDPLRRLGGTPPVPPEPLDALRARSARRRARQRAVLLPLVVVGLLGIGLLAATSLGDDEERQRDTVVVDDPTTTSQPPGTASTTTAVPNVLDPTTLVLAGRDGVSILRPGGAPPTAVTTRAARRAYGLADGTVVALHVDDPELQVPGAVVAYRDGSSRELLPAPEPEQGVRWLHDLVVLDGRATAVVSFVEAEGAPSPATWEIHLALVDVESGARTDLGTVAGWEEGVDGAHILPGGDVVYDVSGFEGHSVHRRTRDGRLVWDGPYLDRFDGSGTLGGPVLVGVDGDAVLVALPQTPEGGEPEIELRRFSTADGTHLGSSTVPVTPAALAEPGFCSFADPVPGGLLCSTDGGFGGQRTVLVDLADGSATTVDGVPDGVAATAVRRAP